MIKIRSSSYINLVALTATTIATTIISIFNSSYAQAEVQKETKIATLVVQKTHGSLKMRQW